MLYHNQMSMLRQRDKFRVMVLFLWNHCRLLYWPGQIILYNLCILQYSLFNINIMSFSVGRRLTKRTLRNSKTFRMSVRYGNKPLKILQTKCENCTQHNPFVSWQSPVSLLFKVWWGKHEPCVAMDGQSRDSKKCCNSWHWHWKWSSFGGNGVRK